ncbi:serine hydrolase domain-containing protein [Pseudoalteromonas luteoviolacea]|uniref:Beta-lactamase-related domain-containing protein n=1 Tax=Pseudoalteromonas luteoviolacea S4054 TaxID=1129367 RepID=A0A0F6AB14_9GAMM|nr:serine hydrolase [Pseudoalteromonas luteoviolacea]AOT06837.1 hypothetical protein S4054249_02635 [Pseudoalteromonas luteoviolacea]AOT11755.1 hypothetical protein S40542_02635 [Pseudoalteromonas luteoviolacea]AOT16667.1 hypothetical protein S4054_02635 [Pseudoalteromonas luteoviolacea]KKE83328.1 hypothetical protein N479_14390 [Pseudoalteromonas luteoviolacea S4054]KZN74055.1 hypothetical protein N481_10095 [Pseudoalteromonas luteoviolacea S4047-1]
MTKYYLTLLLTFLIWPFTHVKAQDNNTFRQQIEQTIQEQKIAGITWTLLNEGQIQIGSTGLANIEKGFVMHDSQKMQIGSVTKAVLAVGILQLVSEGKLSLDTQIRTLLPELAIKNPWRDNSPILVRHLLNHTSGLDSVRMWQYLNTQVTPDTPLINAFNNGDKSLLTARFKPGSQESYSNMGYQLLAMIIESITNTRYETYLDEHLLKPLGMHDSTFTFQTQSAIPTPTSLAMGYHDLMTAQASPPFLLRGAGQFTTTATDMGKFMALILAGGTVHGKTFILPELLPLLAGAHETNAHKAGLKIGHGLVFSNRDRHGVMGHCRPGTTFGFRAHMCVFPDENKAFFYALNTDSETANYAHFDKLFIDQLKVKPANITEAVKEAMPLKDKTGIYFLAPNSMAEFAFVDWITNFVWLSQTKNSLVIHSLQSKDKVIVPVGMQLFRDITRSNATYVFYQNDENQPMLSYGHRTYQKGSVLNLVLVWSSILLGLIGLMGLLLVGIATMIRDKHNRYANIKPSFYNLIMLALPITLYTQQSFMQFGELTAASFCLAIISGLLPLSLIWSAYKTKAFLKQNKIYWLDMACLICALQFCIVLLLNQQLPIIFWQ